MNIIMATSRGRGLKEQLLKANISAKVLVRPGHRYRALTQEAAEIIRASSENPNNIHVYFLAGYTDLTNMEKQGLYQEVTFRESPEEAESRLKSEIQHTTDVISQLGAKVCFATVVPGSIISWNQTRKNQRKTTHLKYEHLYNSWQDNLNKAVILINKTIIQINISHNMHTPKTHECVMSIRKKGKYRFQFNKLSKDGVHPTHQSLQHISRSLSKSITINRQRNTPSDNPPSTMFSPKHTTSETESELDSPKRHWKSY